LDFIICYSICQKPLKMLSHFLKFQGMQMYRTFGSQRQARFSVELPDMDANRQTNQMIYKFSVCHIKLPFTSGVVLKLTSLVYDMND
jgi:hypothetical protein